jgi:hypothetical protein
MLREQLAELAMLVNRNDPLQVEAEAAFARMVAEVLRGAEVGESKPDLSCMMQGTAEAYDGMAQQTESSAIKATAIGSYSGPRGL